MLSRKRCVKYIEEDEVTNVSALTSKPEIRIVPSMVQQSALIIERYDDAKYCELFHAHEYRLHEHVIIAEREGSMYHGEGEKWTHRVVRITKMWEERGVHGYPQMEFEYYFFPKEFLNGSSETEFRQFRKTRKMDKKFEILRSNVTNCGSTQSIVKRCSVLDYDTFKEGGYDTFVDEYPVYFCRFRFQPEHKRYLFASITSMQLTDYITLEEEEPKRNVKPRIAKKYQACMLMQNNVVPPPGHLSFQGSTNSQQLIASFMTLAECLMYACGNYVYTWNTSIHYHAYAKVILHNNNGTLQLKFQDGSLRDQTQLHSILGCVPREELCTILALHRYNVSSSLGMVAHMVSVKQQQIQRDITQQRRENSNKLEYHPPHVIEFDIAPIKIQTTLERHIPKPSSHHHSLSSILT